MNESLRMSRLCKIIGLTSIAPFKYTLCLGDLILNPHFNLGTANSPKPSHQARRVSWGSNVQEVLIKTPRGRRQPEVTTWRVVETLMFTIPQLARAQPVYLTRPGEGDAPARCWCPRPVTFPGPGGHPHRPEEKSRD